MTIIKTREELEEFTNKLQYRELQHIYKDLKKRFGLYVKANASAFYLKAALSHLIYFGTDHCIDCLFDAANSLGGFDLVNHIEKTSK